MHARRRGAPARAAGPAHLLKQHRPKAGVQPARDALLLRQPRQRAAHARRVPRLRNQADARRLQRAQRDVREQLGNRARRLRARPGRRHSGRRSRSLVGLRPGRAHPSPSPFPSCQTHAHAHGRTCLGSVGCYPSLPLVSSLRYVHTSALVPRSLLITPAAHHVHKRGAARDRAGARERRDDVLPELVPAELQAALQEVADQGRPRARRQNAQPCRGAPPVRSHGLAPVQWQCRRLAPMRTPGASREPPPRPPLVWRRNSSSPRCAAAASKTSAHDFSKPASEGTSVRALVRAQGAPSSFTRCAAVASSPRVYTSGSSCMRVFTTSTGTTAPCVSAQHSAPASA